MIQDQDDMTTYQLFKKLSPPPLAPLPSDLDEDLMAMAEAADKEGALDFLTIPFEDEEQAPQGLLDRALALAPRTTTARKMAVWKQALAALVTFAAFGSGSYALASGLSGEDLTTDPFETNDTGLFEAASDSGFFTFDLDT